MPAVQSDGIAALGVASGLLLGLYARRRGIALTDMVTTMLGSCTQALISRNTSYEGRPRLSRVDDEFRGLGPLYRLYRAADGWVFLAAPAAREWAALAGRARRCRDRALRHRRQPRGQRRRARARRSKPSSRPAARTSGRRS